MTREIYFFREIECDKHYVVGPAYLLQIQGLTKGMHICVTIGHVITLMSLLEEQGLLIVNLYTDLRR